MTDEQAQRVQEILIGAGIKVTYRSFPDVGHAMHSEKPELYVETCSTGSRASPCDTLASTRSWSTHGPAQEAPSRATILSNSASRA